MKKFLIITLIAVLAAPLGLEAQRKSGSRSSSSKSTSVRSSSSRKSSSSSARIVKSTPSVKRSSSSVRSTPRSSSSRSKSFATPRSSSSSSRSVVRTKPGNSTRSTTVTRSTSHNNVTTRSNASRESGVRTAPTAAERRTITNRATVGNGNNKSRNISGVAPHGRDVYHSSRRFVSKRLPRYHYRVIPHPRDYRARIYPYRSPAYFHIYWSYNVFRHYCSLYPVIEYWSYTSDYSVSTISAYDALFHVGEIRRVYGKVSEVYYAKETDEFFLYFGAYYPYHDFTTVIPGVIARKFSRHPEFYFQDEHVEVTGLITEYEDKPEIVVKDRDQLRRY